MGSFWILENTAFYPQPSHMAMEDTHIYDSIATTSDITCHIKIAIIIKQHDQMFQSQILLQI